MAQPVFYIYSGAFIPGTLARAEAEATEFTSVQVGFDKLAIQGVDSGAANAYVVTTSGAQNGQYSDGMVVEFKAAYSNTGGSTIAVDSGSTVGLTQPNGQSLAAGAIIANNWYICRYNSTYSAWTVIAPSSTVITSNTISAAAPTHLVGLTPAGGVSTAVAPIDVTFALDQTISPTMTGSWTFAGAVAFSSSVSFASGFTLTGGNNDYAITLDGSATTGESYGVEINAGTNASDIAFLVNSHSGTQFFQILGTGAITVGAPTGGSQGAGTINATGLYVNGVAVSNAVSHNPTATIGLSAVNGVAATFMTSDSAPALSQAIVPTMTGAWTFTPSSAVTAITINAAINEAGFIINGAINTSNANALLQVLAGSGVGFSSGLYLQAGTTSGDYSLEAALQNGTVTFRVQGDGQTYVYAPGAASAGPTGTFQIGFLDTPQNSQSGSYQLAMTDRGNSILMTGSGKTLTIPANSTTAFPTGTSIIVITGGAALTIAITTDTLAWLPSVATGSRTLAARSVATLYKASATTWYIWGFGIT